MSDDSFINRRGREVSVDIDKALNDLYSHKPQDVKPVKKRRNRRSLQLKTWHLVAAGAAIFAFVVVPVAVGEFSRNNYDSEVNNTKKEVSTILFQTAIDQKDGVTSNLLNAKSEQLGLLRDELCKGGFADNIAKLYPRSTESYKQCSDYKSRLTALILSIDQAAEQMAYLEQLEKVLSGVLQPLKDRFAVLASQQENWQSVSENMKRLSVPTSFRSAHASLVKDAGDIRDDWITLVQASNAYDTPAYNAARANLAKSYEAFRNVKEQFSSIIAFNQQKIIANIAEVKND